MEDPLQPPVYDQQARANRNFLIGMTASVLLHVIGTAVLFTLPQGSPARQSITYVDLGAPQPAAPMTPTRKEAALQQDAVKPEMPLPPAKPAVAEAPLKTAQPAPEPTAQTTEARVAEQPARTTLGLGLTKGYFRSLGNGETLREEVRDYYLEMLQAINEKWWLDERIDKREAGSIMVNIKVARSGEIVGSEIMVSSGNPGYDRAVLTALTAASPLPAPPANYRGEIFQVPIRLVPPLNLMAW